MPSVSLEVATLLQAIAGWGGVVLAVLTAIAAAVALWAGNEVALHEKAAQADLNERLDLASAEAAGATAQLAPRRLNADHEGAFQALHGAGIREVRIRLVNADAESTQFYQQVEAAFERAGTRVYGLPTMMAGGMFGTAVHAGDQRTADAVAAALTKSGITPQVEVIPQPDSIPNVMIYPKAIG